MKQETEVNFLFGRVTFGILSFFKKSQASSPFEALNSVCLSRCQRDVISPVQMRRRPTAFSGVSTGDSDIPSPCQMKDEPEFQPLQGNPANFLSEGLYWSIALETENTGSHSQTYCWGKTALEVLVESWLTSSVKDRESAFILRWYEVHGAFLEYLYWN